MQPIYIVSRKGGESVLIVKQTVREHKMNCVKDVSLAYVNLMIIVGSEGKIIGGIAFVPTS